MNTLTFNITARFDTMTEAVEAAGIDLSYNEQLAKRDLERDDRQGFHTDIMVTDDNRVLFVYKVPGKLGILNEYSPHSAGLTGASKWSMVNIKETTVHITAPLFPYQWRDSMEREVPEATDQIVICRSQNVPAIVNLA